MGKLKTKDVKEKGGSINKSISPGNVTARINSIELNQPDFLKKEDGYFLRMNMETRKPSDDFEGFHTQWDDEKSPTYDGQIGTVKESSWPYKDSTTKKGVEIDRDEGLMRGIMCIAIASGHKEWWDATDGLYDTIEDMVEDFNKQLAKNPKFVNICIAGRQYMNRKGYKSWDLFMAKKESGFVSIKAEDDENSKLLTFNKDEHCDYIANQGDDGGDAIDETANTTESIDDGDDFDDDLGF